MKEIKVMDKEGNIYSTDLSSNKCIYEIHFSTSYTQFEVQEVVIDSDGNKLYKKKSVIVPVEGKDDLATAIDFLAVSDDEIGKIVN
jgi:hypothetical protein